MQPSFYLACLLHVHRTKTAFLASLKKVKKSVNPFQKLASPHGGEGGGCCGQMQPEIIYTSGFKKLWRYQSVLKLSMHFLFLSLYLFI
jgi:hypothetical protein